VADRGDARQHGLAEVALDDPYAMQFVAHWVGREPPSLLVLAEMRLKFLAEVNWDATIEIDTRVTVIGTRSRRTGQALFIRGWIVGVFVRPR